MEEEVPFSSGTVGDEEEEVVLEVGEEEVLGLVFSISIDFGNNGDESSGMSVRLTLK